MNNASNSGSQSPTNVQPNVTYSGSVITDLQATVENALHGECCAICGFPYLNHSAGLMGTVAARCPVMNSIVGDEWANTTFHKHGLCEGSIPEYNDPTGENAKPCKSRFGTYRPEHEQVLCDGCAEGM